MRGSESMPGSTPPTAIPHTDGPPADFDDGPSPQVDLSKAVVVGPNDYLVLGWKNATPADLAALKQALRDQHPGISERILLTTRAETVAVIQTNGEKA
jgi:hypothetical protein